jgi:hypothetical protein
MCPPPPNCRPMWFRTAEVTATPDVVRIRHETASGPEVPLRAALLRWDAPGGGAPGVSLAGAAWEGPDGAIFWGWPDDAGQVQLRPGSGSPEVCCILPPALSLALALRRSGSELGTHALVIGEGFLARVARAVASTVGFRVGTQPGGGEEIPVVGAPPDVVIETTGQLGNLNRAVERCRDWGRVFSMAGALTSVRLDYYPHVHRRALTVAYVPDRPVLRPNEEEIAEGGAALLAQALCGIAPSRDEALDARVLPEETPGRLARERSGWGLLMVERR